MRILLNAWSPFLGSGSTDFRILHSFRHLQRQCPELQFVEVRSPVAVVAANVKYVLDRILTRLPARVLGSRGQAWRSCVLLLSYLPPGYLERNGVDLIVSQGYVPWPLSLPVPRVVFANLEGEQFYQRAGLLDQFPYEVQAKRAVLATADLVISYQPASAERLAGLVPSLRGWSEAIPPYHPTLEAIGHDEVRRKHAKTGSLTLAFVGGEAMRKGLPRLLDAWELIAPAIRRCLEFVVVSTLTDGQPRAWPREVRVLRGLRRPELFALLRHTHILVLPTQYDTFGLVLIEGMAHGCSVISSNQEPQDWILGFGQAGLLVDPNSPPAIAAAIERLVIDQPRRLALAEEGRRRFLEVFHHRVVGTRLRAAFERAWRRGRERREAKAGEGR